MALTSGFFNALDHDRRYNAEQVSSIFDGVLVDGVFSTIGDKFIIRTFNGEDMRVTVGTGRAWFNNTWTLNDAVYVLTVPNPHPLLDRIDMVVLEVNHEEATRQNDIKIISGTPSTNPVKPTLVKGQYINQYPLAYITVTHDVNRISQAVIQNTVGTSECPFATGICEHVTTDELLIQWRAQFDEWIASILREADEFQINQRISFEAWFQIIRDQLSTDAAGHLQNQIMDMNRVVLATLRAANWAGATAPFSQTVPVPEIYQDSNTTMYSNIQTTMTETQQKAYVKAYSLLSQGYAETGNQEVTFYVWKKPAIDIVVQLKGVWYDG